MASTQKIATAEAVPSPGSQPKSLNKTTDSNTVAKKETIADSNSTDKKKTAKQPKNPWKFGATLAPGISNINKTIFSGVSSVADVYSYYAAAAGPTAPPAGSAHKPSDVSAAFSVAAGAFAEKQLSKRVSFTVALNYHYYSTRIQTGAKIDTAAPVLFSLTRSSTPGYYLAGTTQEYNNKYHFLELPLNLQWRFNNSRQLPIFLEGGLNISEFLGSDALNYNSFSAIYYKDNDLFQKTQLGASAGLLLGFYLNHTFFQAGPELQYQFTNLLKDKSSATGHLFFTGIKLTMIPKKK